MYIVHQDTKIEVTYIDIYRALLKMNYQFRGSSITLPSGKIMCKLHHVPTNKMVKVVLE